MGFEPVSGDSNFLLQLKNASLIDHAIISFFINDDIGTVKFGGYDESGIAHGHSL